MRDSYFHRKITKKIYLRFNVFFVYHETLYTVCPIKIYLLYKKKNNINITCGAPKFGLIVFFLQNDSFTVTIIFTIKKFIAILDIFIFDQK